MNKCPLHNAVQGTFYDQKLEETEHLRCLHQAAAVVA